MQNTESAVRPTCEFGDGQNPEDEQLLFKKAINFNETVVRRGLCLAVTWMQQHDAFRRVIVEVSPHVRRNGM